MSMPPTIEAMSDVLTCLQRDILEFKDETDIAEAWHIFEVMETSRDRYIDLFRRVKYGK